jgi:hypothetical protein
LPSPAQHEGQVTGEPPPSRSTGCAKTTREARLKGAKLDAEHEPRRGAQIWEDEF